MLQKKRELKMAGIEFSKTTKIKGIDYNKEIPMARSVPKGKFEPSDKETPDVDEFKSNISLQ